MRSLFEALPLWSVAVQFVGAYSRSAMGPDHPIASIKTMRIAGQLCRATSAEEKLPAIYVNNPKPILIVRHTEGPSDAMGDRLELNHVDAETTSDDRS